MIDNPNIQVQIRTRPRGSYSVITQVAVEFKANFELFRFKSNSGAYSGYTTTNGLTARSVEEVTRVSGSDGHLITINEHNSIKIVGGTRAITLTVQGSGGYMFGSVGMCGNWNNGSVRFQDGSVYETSGFGADNAFALALNWRLPFGGVPNHMTPSSAGSVCDGSDQCGPGHAFPCGDLHDGDGDEDRVLSLQAKANCKEQSCANIEDWIHREACEVDIALTGDTSWACEHINADPILYANPKDFVRRPEDKIKNCPNNCDEMNREWCKYSCNGSFKPRVCDSLRSSILQGCTAFPICQGFKCPLVIVEDRFEKIVRVP